MSNKYHFKSLYWGLRGEMLFKEALALWPGKSMSAIVWDSIEQAVRWEKARAELKQKRESKG